MCKPNLGSSSSHMMQPTLTNLIEVPGLTHIPSQVHGDKIDAPFEGIEAGYLTLQ